MIPLANTGNGTVGAGSISVGSGGAGCSEGDCSEPMAFTLNTASFSDNFSIIEDESKELNDKNYNWDFITNDNNITDGIKNIATPISGDDTSGSGGTKSERTSQSIEELKKLRDAQF